MSTNQFIESLRQLRFTAFALISDDGRLLDASEGFQTLLPPRQESYVSSYIGRFFLSPRIDDLVKSRNNVSGLFTLGSYSGKTATLSGTFRRMDDCWLFLGEHDTAQSEDINAKLVDLNYQLAEAQRQISSTNAILKAREAQAIHDSYFDALTGLGNRRQLEQALKIEMARAGREHRRLSMIMCDLDHFKAINDHYGHDAGDAVLKLFSGVVSLCIRPFDLAARFGGEEFVILMPGARSNEAVEAAERIRSAIEKEEVVPQRIKVTASFGVAELSSEDTPESFLKKADNMLYKAKETGRNRVVEFEGTAHQ
jgi:diguanylate cyclase (GGDEF)-like protein